MKKIVKLLLLSGYITTLVFLIFLARNGEWWNQHEFLRQQTRSLLDKSKEYTTRRTTTNQKEARENPSGPAHIIVLTYMRSGSTFIGDVLQEDPSVFYLFEPLRIFQFIMREKRPIRYLDGRKGNYSNFLDLASDTIDDLSACRFENVGIGLWQDGFISKSKKAQEFTKCTSRFKVRTLSRTIMRFCARLLSKLCKSSNYIVSKTIRIPMYILEPMMDRYPNMKIIHLLRDPRATIYSQSHFGVIRKNHFDDDALKFCARVYEDLITSRSIRRKYPDRVLRIMYEDLAKNPIEVSRLLYNFAAMNYTLKTKAFVENLTSAQEVPKTDEECAYLCTMKSNSSAQAESWRNKASFGEVYTIDRLCRPLLKELKLRDIPSPRELRDISGYRLSENNAKFDDFRWA